MALLDDLTANASAVAKIIAVVLAAAGGAYSFYNRRIKRPRLSRAARSDKAVAQYAQQFAENPDALRFFKDLQLQYALERTLGFAPMPSEFPAVFRFHRQEQASLRDLKLAWQHRRPSTDEELAFALDAPDRVVLWLGRLYSVCCFLAGAAIFALIMLTPYRGPVPALEEWTLGLLVTACAFLPLLAGQSELAVKRIEYRRGLQPKRLPPAAAPPSGDHSW